MGTQNRIAEQQRRHYGGMVSDEQVPPAPIVMYWRPGCGFSAALERQMIRRELVFDKRNIWDDYARRHDLI